MRYSSSEKKKQQVKEFQETPLVVGDLVSVARSSGKLETLEIVSIDPLKARCLEYKTDAKSLKPADIVSRSSRHIGADPFMPEEKIRTFSFPLESIIEQVRLAPGCTTTDTLNGIRIQEYNPNPVVKVGKKYKHYQRDYCWVNKDKQALIDSIYNNVDCGLVIVRLRSLLEITQLHKDRETPSFRDIVDGKQRIEAIRSFIFDEYPDSEGNYFSDLSDSAQYRFRQSKCMTYAEIAEDSSDDLILRQFLKMNFCGIPQSPEHMKYVAELYEKRSK